MSGIIPSNGSGGGNSIEGYPQGAYPPPGTHESEDTVNLRELVDILRRNWWAVVLSALLFGSAAYYITSRQAPEYRAAATIRLKNEREALAGGIDGAMAEQMLGRTVDPLLSQMEVLRSRTLAGSVVDSLGLRLVSIDGIRRIVFENVRVDADARLDTLRFRFHETGYEVASNAGSLEAEYGVPVRHAGAQFLIRSRPELPEGVAAIISHQVAVENFRRHLSASRREFTDVVEVSFTAQDPALAQMVINATVAVFQGVNARDAQDQSRRRRKFLEEQLTKSDSGLAEAQTALSDFRRREAVLSSRERFAAEQAGIMELEVRREEMRADRSVYVSLLNALNTRDSTDQRALRALVSAPGLSQNAVISQLYQQFVRYQGQRDSLITGRWSSTSNNPDVQRLNTLIERSEQSLIDAANSHLAALDARIRAHDDLIARSQSEIRALPDKEAEEMRLAQNLQTIREMSTRLREQVQAATVAEAVEVGQVVTVDLASVPLRPIGTRRSLKVFAGLFGGVAIGIVFAFLREQMNNRIRGKQDIEVLLGLAPLGVIPKIPNVNGTKSALPLRLPIRNGGGNGKVERPLAQLVTASEERSNGAEAYRSLRTNLLFSAATNSMRSLMVTSALPSEGKTTTAANLAVAFAQQGKKIVLMDADLRKARVHKIFGIEREPGLVDVLAGQVELADVIRPVGVAGLSVITAGTLPPNPSELLGSKRMPEIMRALEQEFDLVLVDAPPVLVAGDASIVGTLASAALVVVRAGVTERPAAKAAVDQLLTVGTRIAGAVLNDPDAKIESSEGYYYYAYKYYGEG